jgi:hypothetical protein
LVISSIGVLLITVTLILKLTLFSIEAKLDRLAEKYLDLSTAAVIMAFDENVSMAARRETEKEVGILDAEIKALLNEMPPAEKASWMADFQKKMLQKQQEIMELNLR